MQNNNRNNNDNHYDSYYGDVYYSDGYNGNANGNYGNYNQNNRYNRSNSYNNYQNNYQNNNSYYNNQPYGAGLNQTFTQTSSYTLAKYMAKTYLWMFFGLAITFGLALYMMFNSESVSEFVINHYSMYLGASAASLVMLAIYIVAALIVYFLLLRDKDEAKLKTIETQLADLKKQSLHDIISELGTYDLVADMHSVLRSLYIRTAMRLRGAKVAIIDKGRRDKWHLTRGHHAPLRHNTLRYADVFAELGLTILLPEPVHSPGEGIGIAPFAAHAGKIYPLERMESVVAQLSGQGISILLPV